MEIKKGDLFPGDKVSVDHYQSAGRDYKSRGSPPPQEMFNGGAIFVDHASGRIFVHHQVSLTAVESIKAKLALDRETDLHNQVHLKISETEWQMSCRSLVLQPKMCLRVAMYGELQLM